MCTEDFPGSDFDDIPLVVDIRLENQRRKEKDLQHARAVLKLDALEKERGCLLSELSEMEGFNRSAWEGYGSELCAGEMLEKEEVIRKQIIAIKAEIKLLNQYLHKTINMNNKHRLELEL